MVKGLMDWFKRSKKTPSGEVLPAPEHLEFVDDGAAAVLLTTPTSSIALVPQIARGDALRQQDFKPVITIGSAPICFVVGPAVPAEVRTLRDYLR